jgi:hypothetical protein
VGSAGAIPPGQKHGYGFVISKTNGAETAPFDIAILPFDASAD